MPNRGVSDSLGSRARELLDAVLIRDVDVPVRVGRHAARMAELTDVRANTPPRGEEGAVSVELLDGVFTLVGVPVRVDLHAPIGDVDVPVRGGCHAGRVDEFTDVRAVPPPGGEEGALCVELLDAEIARQAEDGEVARFSDVDVSARVGRHADGPVELSAARALAPPRGEGGAVRVELLDAETLRDVD